MRSTATLVLLSLAALGGCDADDVDPPAAVAATTGLPLPDGARPHGTADEHCADEPGAQDTTPIESAFVGVVLAIDDTGPNRWVTFDVDQWFTPDFGTEQALFADDWDGAVGERWLVAASRYSVGPLSAGEIFPCASEVYSTTGVAAWELSFGAPVDAGAAVPEQPADPNDLAAIETARERWLAAAPESYTYAVQVYDRADWLTEPAYRCGLGAIRVVVEAGAVTQARDLRAHCDVPLLEAPMLDELFELAETNAGALVAPPRFDERYGYVQSVEARDRSVDVSVWLSEFVPRAVPITVGDIDDVVSEARSRWRASGPTSYRAVVEVICFCDVPGRVDVTVVDGTITSGIPESLDWIDPSIDGLFDHIEAARLDDDGAELAFDPVHGYPVALRFDGDAMTVDDELELHVHELTPLP